jgi:hypothetical protein
MEAEEWPNAAVAFAFPERSPETIDRWQIAIDDAFLKKALRLMHRGGWNYDLTGLCPRCGHDTAQSLKFCVLQSARSAGRRIGSSQTRSRFDVVCSCEHGHEPRKEGLRGCGWGRGLPVVIDASSAD